MSDPASWRVIEPGWKVLAAGGEEVGAVDLVVGDSNADIFDGLAIATSALGKPRYVASEQVAEVSDGAVRLSLSAGELATLPDYREPATSARIIPDDRGGLGTAIAGEARELEGELVRPRVGRERPVGLLRRVGLLLRRMRGR